MTVLQRTWTKEQSVSRREVDMSERSGQSDAGFNVSEYCAKKLRSFAESEIGNLEDLNEESVTRFLGEGDSQLQVSRVTTSIHENAGVSILSNFAQISTPVKLPDDARFVAKSLKVTPVRSPVKRISNFVVGFNEISEGIVCSVRPAKLKEFGFG